MGEKNYGTEEAFYVLNKIYQLKKVVPDGNLLEYKIEFPKLGKRKKLGKCKKISSNIKKEISFKFKQDEILHDLRNWGAFKIDSREQIDNELVYYLEIYPKFEEIYNDHKNIFTGKTEKENDTTSLDNQLKSIHLITKSLEPTDVIFLVLDERFEIPTRCAVKNNKGKDTYIKKLYNIAYIVNAPNKKVDYSKALADSINNGLFRKRPIAKYMRTNKLKKPTLVQKSEDKKILVLTNEVTVITRLINNIIPSRYKYLYIDKIQ